MDWFLTTARAGEVIYDLFLKARAPEEARQIAHENALERSEYVPHLFIIQVQKIVFRRAQDADIVHAA